MSKKVVISGFYGFHNIGDEAILKTLVRQLRTIDPEVDITVLSQSPEETAAKFDVRAIKRNALFQVLWAILRCQVLLSGGGSLLQDDTSARSIHYYLGIIHMGLLFRKRVFLVSNGIGPLVRPSNRKRVARTLNRVTFITLRDARSYALLESIGVKPEKMAVTSDMVMGMEMESLDAGAEILSKVGVPSDSAKRRVAIAIREKDFREAAHKTALLNLANALAEKFTVIFVPFYYKNDTKIHATLNGDVGEAVYFIQEKYNSAEFMSLIQNMDILVGSRLHSLVFSVVAEKPFVGVSYDPKIESFLEMIGERPVCSMKDFDAEAIYRQVMAIDAEYTRFKEGVQDAKAYLRRQLDINLDMLRKAL